MRSYTLFHHETAVGNVHVGDNHAITIEAPPLIRIQLEAVEKRLLTEGLTNGTEFVFSPAFPLLPAQVFPEFWKEVNRLGYELKPAT